jgi:hypothetical protein
MQIENLLLVMDPGGKTVAGPEKKSFVELRREDERIILCSASVLAVFET